MVDAELPAVVVDLLGRRWSPEQVAHELHERFADQPARSLCTESIYQAIYDPDAPVTRPAKRRRRRRRRRVQGLERRGRLTAMTMIADRPAEVADRVQVGHWEGDCIMGAGNRSAIGTLVERRARYLIPFVVARGMAFAVHGAAELSFTGAAAGLVAAGDAVAGALLGSLVVATAIGVLGVRERERDSAIGVVLAFGLGLGVYLLSRYHGFATAATSILFGQIFGISNRQLLLLLLVAVAVLLVMAFIYRPLQFPSATRSWQRRGACGSGSSASCSCSYSRSPSPRPRRSSGRSSC